MIGWDRSDINLSRDPLADYDFSESEEGKLSMSFLGVWAPSPDDELDHDLMVLEAIDSEGVSPFSKKNSVRLQPNGIDWAEVAVNVKRGNNPASGVPVEFSIEAVRPTNGWRNTNEVAQRMKGNAAKFRKRVASGRIKLLGTMSPTVVRTDADGNAISRYTVSNIGGNQTNMALERILMSSQAGTTRFDVNIGYDFVNVPKHPKGLRIVGANGRHCQSPLAKILKNLGKAVAEAKWPHPVTITAASLRWGGLYPPHMTHQHGGTLDLRPMSTDGGPTWCKTDGTHKANYDRNRTRLLISVLSSTGATRIYFNDPKTKQDGASPLAGHNNHIHFSWIPNSVSVASLVTSDDDIQMAL